MEQIKQLTKSLIANSFKELMLQMPFEKITIKTITDHANVIRPTFYNHFHDKFELMEWIVQTEILDDARELFEQGKAKEGMVRIFTGFYEDREYYRKAFEITGQNGFASTLSDLLVELIVEAGEKPPLDKPDNSVLTLQLMAQYYTSGLITILRNEVCVMSDTPVEEVIEAYQYLVEHTIYEIGSR